MSHSHPSPQPQGEHEDHSAHEHDSEPPARLSDAGHTGHDSASLADHHDHGRASSTDLERQEVHVSGGHDAGHHGDHESHDRHAGHDPDAFRRLFWRSLVLTIPVVAFSEMVQDWFGYSLDWVPGHQLVAPVFGTVLFFYGGRVFLQGGWNEIRWRQPGMMLLISMAITVAFGASVASEFGWLDLDFWWELAALITVMLLGHWQEMRALGLTRGALAALAELLPDEAERVGEDGTTTLVALAELREGDVVLVRPGSRVPADGAVIDGRAELDESMLTGESKPVLREVGDRVSAGTVALGSALRVRVDALGDETALAGIQRLVAEAQASRSRTQDLADRAAAALFWIAVGAGILTLVVWTLLGDVGVAIERTVSVLVIACPHALGLAIPLVIAISTEVSARSGILVKDRLSLERMRSVDVVLFDKTGTLTEGRPTVTGTWSASGDNTALLRLAGAAESASEHPLATAIVERAREAGPLPAASEFTADPGRGVHATVEGASIEVGGPRLLREQEVDASALPSDVLDAWLVRGATVLYVLRDGALVGAVALEDRVREASREAVNELHAAGVRVAMITGDARNVADAVAADLGIDEVFAEVLPEHKAEHVVELQQRGMRVAMVGDGVNDAPALAQADVGLAIGAGADVAIQSAGVILASDDPRAVSAVMRLSQAAYRKMIQNLAWATGYNVIAIPLAAGVFAWAGFVMPPAVAALLMSASTVIVAINALLLRRVDLRPHEAIAAPPGELAAAKA